MAFLPSDKYPKKDSFRVSFFFSIMSIKNRVLYEVKNF